MTNHPDLTDEQRQTIIHAIDAWMVWRKDRMKNGQGYIIAGQDAGGFRHFLDGRAIHAGDQLDVQIAGAWIRVRYESDVRNQDGFLIIDELHCISVNRSTLPCRWLSEEASEEEDEISDDEQETIEQRYNLG